MKANLIKLFVLAGILVLAVIVIGGINTTSADVPAQGKPPTVALPTREGTKPPTLTATPTKPGVVPQVGATPVAPLKATVTRTPTRGTAVRSTRGSTTKALSTNFTLVNMSNQQANVTVQYIKEDGSNWPVTTPDRTDFTIAANGGQKILRQYDDPNMPSGRGAVVVSSTQPLGAVAQVLARNQIPSSGAYSGFSQTSSTFYVPLVMRRLMGASGLSNSQVMIQNAGTASVSNVTVQFLGATGTNYTKSGINIPAGATYYYDLDDEVNLPEGWYGSAVVSTGSSAQIAVVVNLFAGAHMLQTYNAFTAESLGTTWFVPLFTSRLANGLSTPISIQNLSGGTLATGSVQLDCTPDPGSGGSSFSKNNTTSIDNNRSYYFNPVVDMSIPANWYGSCRITSSGGNIVAFVQMRKIGTDEAGAYEAINANGTNKKAFFPLVAKRLGNGFATAVTIQNLSTSAQATVTLTYTPSPEYVAAGGNPAVLSTTTTIDANKSLIQNQRLSNFSVGGTLMPDGWYGTLTVTSNQPVDGFVQLTNINPQSGDTFMAHNAFTQP